MFACLYLPPRVSARVQGSGVRGQGEHAQGSGLRAQELQELVQLARDFSPRVETHGDRVVTLDIDGLGSLLGDARAVGEELRRTAADRGLRLHIAIAATATAAILLAQSRAGLLVVASGEEAGALAPLPLESLSTFAALRSSRPTGAGRTLSSAASKQDALEIGQLRRWGLRTLGDLAALPAADLSERLGQQGLAWQRWARGQDARPLVPSSVEPTFEEALDLEWPIDGLEPLSFVLARLFDPLCDRLEQADRGAVVLHVTLTLVDKQRHERSLQLPAPMRDARVLRTLALLDLESNPPPAAIDRVRVGVEVTEGRVLQFGLFARALPAERLATLLARLGAVMGSDRVGAPAIVDSYRPGAFTMAAFEPKPAQSGTAANGDVPRAMQALATKPLGAAQIVRRFRSPIPARVILDRGRPIRIVTDRRGMAGGKVEQCDGPWRSSGDWWLAPGITAPPRAPSRTQPWNCDEWDFTLSDGASYRVSQVREDKDAWFIDGTLD